MAIAFFLLLFSPVRGEQLDETWSIRIGGLPARANADGTVTIQSPFSAESTQALATRSLLESVPHFVRLVGFQPDGDRLRYVYSEPIQLQPGEIVIIGNEQLTFSNTLPFLVTEMTVTSSVSTLSAIGDTTTISVTATRADGSQEVIPRNHPTLLYQSSDDTLGSISRDGLVTAQRAGTFVVSVSFEGITGSLRINVVPPPPEHRIIGFVYGPDDEPMSQATVHAMGTTRTAVTDVNGRYVIENVPPSQAPLWVRVVRHGDTRCFGTTTALDTNHVQIDGGILIGHTIDQLLALPCTDADQDCLPDEIETLLGLNPQNPDSDGDGIPDGSEDTDADRVPNRIELQIGTQPQLSDSDNDGLSDGQEVFQFLSIPMLADSDGNGVIDGEQDQDLDGLLDVIEDANGNYLVDAGESDPRRLDTDHDGVADPLEIAERTGVNDEFSYEPRRLASFSFDSPQFLGNENQEPLDRSTAVLAGSFRPTGRSGFHATPSSRLVYPIIQPNRTLNLNLLRGTVKFWFQPRWNSGERGGQFGSRLIEVGHFSPTGVDNDGWWGLFLNEDRTKMTFGSQGANGFTWERYVEVNNLSFRAGEWYEIELTYGPRVTYPYGHKDPDRAQLYANVFIYINGIQMGRGFGVDPTLLPNDNALRRGFAIGSELAGTLSAEAVFDELFTYNYPLHAWNSRILTDRNWEAVANAAANTITLQRAFPRTPARPHPVDIYRRRWGSDDWGQPIASQHVFPLFVDRDVSAGVPYEYRFLDTQALDPVDRKPLLLQQHLTAAIELPPMLRRGKAIMLIENSILDPLKLEIDQFKSDLVGDGWEVVSHRVSRQIDENVELNENAIRIIKGLVNLEATINQTNVVIILGHVPVPMSGILASDGHTDEPGKGPDHRGAWTADGFYGATNRTFWTDIGPHTIENLDSPQNSNRPGDGKFDQDYLPQPFGHAVGRIDFARLDSFTNAPFLPGYPGLSVRQVEIELLRQYLKKNHRYRHGELKFKPRMASFRGFGQNPDIASGFYNAHNVAASWFGIQDTDNINVRALSQRVSYTVGFHEMNSFNTGMALGWEYENITNTYSYRSRDFTNPLNEPQIAFHLKFGSYFGDFNLNVDNWLKALLSTPNSGLAALYYVPDKWRLEKMGLGAPLAVGMQEFNDQSKYAESLVLDEGAIVPFYAPFHGPPRMLSILGDPTLRIHVLPSPRSLQATRTGRSINLTWDAPDVPGVHYLVFRSSNGLDGPFGHLTAISPATRTRFLDSVAPFGPQLYGVRAAKLHDGPSGSYMNLSQATFIEVE